MKTTIIITLISITLLSCSKEFFHQEDTDPFTIYNLRTEASIQRDLLWLSSSLCLAHEQLWVTDSGETYNHISKIILNNARWGVSDYYAISYEKLLNEAEAQSIELDEIMNDIIRDIYNVNSDSNIVREILENNYHNNHYYRFHIAIPSLNVIADEVPNANTESVLISNNNIHNLSKTHSYFSYIHNNDDEYPIQGFHADLDDLIPYEISFNLSQTNLVFISVFDYLPSNLYFNADYVIIDDCYVLERSCQECPYVNHNDPLEHIALGGGAMDHELQINLLSANCFTMNDGSLNYAVLKAFPADCYYYGIVDGGESKSAYRVDLPLFSLNSGKYGNYLALCESECLFKVWGEALGGANYSVASGGVYSLSVPGVTGDPVYFSFPFGHNIWYYNGPDLHINYDVEIDGMTMCGIDDEFYDATSANYTYNVNEFLANNIVDPANNRYIASTDLTELLNYWKDNWVHVGFATNGGAMITDNNFHDFEATTPTTPTIPADLGEEIGHLTRTFAADVPYYKIENEFYDEISYEGGEEFILKVFATFENGEEIDEYRYVTLDELPFEAEVSEIHTFFHGKIFEYDVKVYTRL